MSWLFVEKVFGWSSARLGFAPHPNNTIIGTKLAHRGLLDAITYSEKVLKGGTIRFCEANAV